jgi:DNA methylase
VTPAGAAEFIILSQSGERPERAPALPIVGRAIISIVVLGGVVTPVVGVDVGIAERALRPLEIGAPIRKAEESLWRTFRAGRMNDLRAHPTVKPTAMIADAMKDCTRRNEIVLDTFCGSGATLLAAERVGRRGYGLEIDPGYVDVAVRRWQAFSGKDALHVASGLTFEEIGLQRVGQKAADRTSAVDMDGRR